GAAPGRSAGVRRARPAARPGAVAASTASPGLWSFRPVRRPPVPPHRDPQLVWNPVDAFVLARLRERGLRPPLLADRRTLIRRVYFDLIGLPPPPERVEAFLRDTTPQAFPKLVDELLASPQYGERWARHWLDAARYADSGGYETDIYYRNAWRYRDYVVRAFQEDRPYDRFVQEQVAADELWPDSLELDGSYKLAERRARNFEARLGTGLYALGPQIHESNMDAPKRTYERLTDWVDTTGSLFMGLTLGCARCHDHKFDPLSQRDYFRLQAAFSGALEVEVPVVHGMGIADYRQHYPKALAVDEARRAYRLFEERTKGRPLTEAEQAEQKQRVEAVGRAVLALPAADAQGAAYDGIMDLPTATVLGRIHPALVPKIRVLGRGELVFPREEVTPGLPARLAGATHRSPDLSGPHTGRKELALWLTRPDHPLTARVLVNRIWGWHFGRGLVPTPNDFGKMGQAPSHPELLDWLAATFVEKPGQARGLAGPGLGWSIKKLHRLLLLSRTYQASSAVSDPEALRVDPENRLLWRANRRRLEGEALWDALHSVAGTLNLKSGGRPVVPPLAPDELAALREKWHWPVSADPKEHTRRGLYLLVRRNFRFPLFEVFDAPVNSVSCPGRDVSTVAPQALWFLNNGTALRQAAAFAARLRQEGGDTSAGRVQRAWRLAL
ncbi:MAG: DUF1549 domain-containing protein, partial [Armatimonadetes bacterium]|nr:DUF1549 domain-containing protein [Armatimonadota bacterium]